MNWLDLVGVGLSEPSSIKELLVRTNMVAYESKLLSLPHPSQHYLHVPLAC